MIVTLSGDNTYMAQQALRQLVDKYQQKYSQANAMYFDAEEDKFEELEQAISSNSLFAQSSLVILRHISAKKEYWDKLVDLLDEVPESTVLIIFDLNLDKRTKLFKRLKKTNFKEFKSLDPIQLKKWVIREVEKRGGEISSSIATDLIDKVGDDQWTLSNEIDKLVLYSPKITKETIEEIASEHINDTIFQLLDISMKDRQKTLDRYNRLIQSGMDAQYILTMILWQLNNILLIKSAKDPSNLGISPFVIQKTRPMADRIDQKKLMNIIQYALEADTKSKTTSIDTKQLVEQLLSRLS